jgi:hypothetical protein
MRYFINPNESVLAWLLNHDEQPHVLPVFPEDTAQGLVVAHLLSGGVVAEVIPTPADVKDVCGDGIPLGRLYFQIPRNLLYSVCGDLRPEVFGGSAM